MTLSDVTIAVKAYISAEPWKKIPGGGALILGVQRETGTKEYAVVTGRENGYALALCPDEQALAGYAALLEARSRNENELEQVSLTLDQNCIECRLIPENENALEKWLSVFGVEAVHEKDEQIQILRYQPSVLPQTPEDGELDELACALYAAADYVNNPAAQKAAEQDGVPCARPDGRGGFLWEQIDLSASMRLQFPSPALDDELAARRLRRLPVSGAVVRAAVRRLPMPMDDEALRVPTVMILIDDRMGVVAAPMIGDYEKEYGTFAAEYIAYVEENGRPTRILATDPRTYSLLSDLAAQMSTPIQRAGSMPEINDAVDGLMDFLKAKVAEEFSAAEEDADEPENELPGIGGVLYDGFEGTMEEVGAHLLDDNDLLDPDLEENLLIRVTYPEDPAFWLYAAAKMDTALRHIDNFIRNTWVECCGHMSFFEIDGKQYTSNTRILPGKSMNAKAADVMKIGLPVDYEYDLGSPTDLQVEIVGRVRFAPRREKVLYLAQNYMPKYRCVRCGRRAELVSRPDMGPIAEDAICARCSREEMEIGAYLPLLNSPRTGVCGYGLWFDDEDDE